MNTVENLNFMRKSEEYAIIWCEYTLYADASMHDCIYLHEHKSELYYGKWSRDLHLWHACILKNTY
jgi:hypothetical protein